MRFQVCSVVPWTIHCHPWTSMLWWGFWRKPDKQVNKLFCNLINAHAAANNPAHSIHCLLTEQTISPCIVVNRSLLERTVAFQKWLFQHDHNVILSTSSLKTVTLNSYPLSSLNNSHATVPSVHLLIFCFMTHFYTTQPPRSPPQNLLYSFCNCYICHTHDPFTWPVPSSTSSSVP